MEIIIEINEHLAAGDLCAVFEFDRDEDCTDQCDRNRDDPYCRFVARMKETDSKEAEEQ